jgi:hypothetical protein
VAGRLGFWKRVGAHAVAATLAIGCAGDPFAASRRTECGDSGDCAESIDSGGSADPREGGSANTAEPDATDREPDGGRMPHDLPFPSTPILDQFGRELIGSGWVGATDSYSLVDGLLTCEGNHCPPLLWGTRAGAEQEVYATLAVFPGDASEMNLIVKAQGTYECDLIEILFDPADGGVRIDYCVGAMWYQLGTVPVAIERGDQLGARIRPEAGIEVFRNGRLIATFGDSDIPFLDEEGRIGVNGLPNGGVEAWDDFGGGTL